MPLYEFICRDCSMSFSELCRLQWEGTVQCPACKSGNPSKAISQISASGGGAGEGSAQSGCGSCSGKNCSGCR